MARQIIIGKEGNQPFAIQDPKVSRRHACLTIADNGRLSLVDTKSTNGTYIYNGSTFVRLTPDQPYEVYPDTMIQLGTDTRFHIRRLLPQQAVQPAAAPAGVNPRPAAPGQQPQQTQQAAQPKKAEPKKINIAYLRQVSDQYTERKMQLESKSGMINGLRSCTIIITMLAGSLPAMLSEQMGIAEDNKVMATVISIVAALLLMILLLVIINSFNKKIIRRRNENERDYAVKYCCPECGLSFRGKIYENILSERRCPRCKSEFYESNPAFNQWQQQR